MKLVVLAPLVALLAVAPVTAKPKAYHAVGTEPFWTLDIGPGSIVYKRVGGDTIVTATPAARAIANGRRYATRRITIEIRHARCNDGMGNRTYPDEVKLLIGGEVIMGCGGDPLIDENLVQETDWTVASIGGRPVPGTRRPTVSFADGRVSGNAGCNSFGGGYKVERGALTASRVISTRMACLGPGIMQAERKFLSILAGPARITLDGNRLILKAAAGTAILAPK